MILYNNIYLFFLFFNFDCNSFSPILNCTYSNNIQHNLLDKITIKQNKNVDLSEKINKLKDNHNNLLKNISKKYDKDEKDEKDEKDNIKKNTIIKGEVTKFNKKINNINKIIKTLTLKIILSNEQHQIINKWMIECTKVYNYCVDLYNKDSKSFNLDYKKQKLIIFNKMYGKNKKPAPYDILTDEVRSFCSNIKSCLANLNDKHITHFKIKYKFTKDYQSILIPKKSINNNGFFPSFLKEINGFKKIINKSFKLFEPLDSRLGYDKIRKIYYINLPKYYNKKIQESEKSEVCALDPGEKIFMVSYGFEKCIKFGENIRIPIFWQNNNYNSGSFNRIDSNIGYTINNIQLTLKCINSTKSYYNDEYVKNIFKLITENL